VDNLEQMRQFYLALALPLSWSHYARLVRGARSVEERDSLRPYAPAAEASAFVAHWFRLSPDAWAAASAVSWVLEM
jgi:hypothetical protein